MAAPVARASADAQPSASSASDDWSRGTTIFVSMAFLRCRGLVRVRRRKREHKLGLLVGHALAHHTRPPCASIRPFAMYRPRPRPSILGGCKEPRDSARRSRVVTMDICRWFGLHHCSTTPARLRESRVQRPCCRLMMTELQPNARPAPNTYVRSTSLCSATAFAMSRELTIPTSRRPSITSTR